MKIIKLLLKYVIMVFIVVLTPIWALIGFDVHIKANLRRG